MITLSDINRMHHRYMSETGRAPTRIYLGHEEHREMCRIGEIYICGSLLEDRGFTQKIMGMLVFEVAADRHLFVC